MSPAIAGINGAPASCSIWGGNLKNKRKSPPKRGAAGATEHSAGRSLVIRRPRLAGRTIHLAHQLRRRARPSPAHNSVRALQPPLTAAVVNSTRRERPKDERTMRLVPYTAVLALLLATSACSDWFDHRNAPASNQGAGTGAFSNGLRTNQSQPTNCSPADATCGAGIGNPSVQSPAQKRELGTQTSP